MYVNWVLVGWCREVMLGLLNTETQLIRSLTASRIT